MRWAAGRGELARTLAERGYDVVGIEPEAPEGSKELSAALAKIVALLEPGGVLVVNEFARDRADEPTADWHYGQRDILAAGTRGAP